MLKAIKQGKMLMGAWGADILEEDVAADVYADFMERFAQGMEIAAIRSELENASSGLLEDQDDMPSFWLALAKAQWDCGQLQPDVFAKVSELISTGQGLGRWKLEGEETLQERKQALAKFLALISEPNTTPCKRGQKVFGR